MGIKIHRNDNLHGVGKGGWLFQCPACEQSHSPSDAWQFNGDLEKPTFSPSILVKWYKYDNPNDLFDVDGNVKVGPDGKVAGKKIICHSFVANGKIQYLDDCTHELAGQTIELPGWLD